MPEETFTLTAVASRITRGFRLPVQETIAKTGFRQRRQVYDWPLWTFTLTFDLLKDADVRTFERFLLRRRGAFEAFLWQFPPEPSPVAEELGYGDGSRTLFKVWGDKADAVVVKKNGVTQGQPGACSVDLATGIITFVTAPAAGDAITADVTNELYRVTVEGEEFGWEWVLAWLVRGHTVRLIQDRAA